MSKKEEAIEYVRSRNIGIPYPKVSMRTAYEAIDIASEPFDATDMLKEIEANIERTSNDHDYVSEGIYRAEKNFLKDLATKGIIKLKE